MANRTPTSHHDDQPTEPMPVWTPPQPGDYRYLTGTIHEHDADITTSKHPQGDRPHYHDPDSGIVVFFAAPAPTGAAAEVDPPPAASMGDAATPGVGDAARARPAGPGPRADGSGGTAGAGRPNRARDELGRFIGRSREKVPAPLPTVVALEHALIDVDADLFLAGQHRKLEMGRTVLDAIAFGVEADRLETAMATYAGMLVRLGSDGGGS
jgi:hypothetical protein